MIKWLWSGTPDGKETYAVSFAGLLLGFALGFFAIYRGVTDLIGLAAFTTGIITSSAGVMAYRSVQHKRAEQGNYPPPARGTVVMPSPPPAPATQVNVGTTGNGGTNP